MSEKMNGRTDTRKAMMEGQACGSERVGRFS